MTLEEIYKNHQIEIEKAMAKAFNAIRDDLNKDEDIELSDDELYELIFDIQKLYTEKGDQLVLINY